MRTFLLAASALVAVPAAAQQPSRSPKLVVAISVDQLSSDCSKPTARISPAGSSD